MLLAMADALRMLPSELAAQLHFIGMGQGVSATNPAFSALMPPGLPAHRLHLLDKRADVARLLRALDIYVLSSMSEAFPNSLAEAMASARACVSTAVGECPEVLALPDLIVPAGDAGRLAGRIAALAAMDESQRRAIGDGNRERIMERFTLARMVERFDALFLEAAGMTDGAGSMAAGAAGAVSVARRRS
jgi:glycosyltransferase involved in cell wall biosynthesis